MDTKKLVVLECLDKDDVAYGEKYVLVCLDEGVLECLDNNDKDHFNVDFLHARPLE